MKTRIWWGPLLAAAFPVLLGAAAPARPPAPGEAERWLRSVGEQRLRASWHLVVAMTLRGGGGFRQDYVLDTRWAAWKGSAGALAVVLEPGPLRGLALLSREESRPGVPDRSWVFLNTRDPTVLAVDTAARSEGLLGSDVSHDEGQRLLDPADYDLSFLGEVPCGAGRCVRLAGVPRRRPRSSLGADRVVWWIDRDRREIAKAEWLKAGRPLKTLEVEEWAASGGLWVPRRQTMTQHELGSRTTLTLRRCERVAGFPAEDFQPERLPEMARRTLREQQRLP